MSNSKYPRRALGDEDLFFEPHIAGYLANDRVVTRTWLLDAVEKRISLSTSRFVLLVGEPGAGKTGVITALAHAHPGWLRYFIRKNSTEPLSDGDASSFLLRIGHQLAHLHPDAFDPQNISIEVEQKVGVGESVVGVRIEDLQVSPFYVTSLKVKQEVAEATGSVNAIEIGRATLNPRLLEASTLGHLALLEPAKVLLREQPGEPLVVLVDALDEIFISSGYTSIFDWIEQCPEPPANIRFVISCRPDPRLDALRATRELSAHQIDFDTQTSEVLADAQRFARNLFQSALVPADPVERERAALELAKAADGNFSYLTAYARGLLSAVEATQPDEVNEFLDFRAAPKGLEDLYFQFVRRMQRNVDRLGPLEEVESGVSIPGWERVGLRFLGVLCVAKAPLPLHHLLRLSGARVSMSDARSVLKCMAAFLEQSANGWSLFHASVGEVLSSKKVQSNWEAVDPQEWHQRIVQAYRGDNALKDIDWKSMDDYGLRYLPAHINAASDSRIEVSELLTSELRSALKKRFFTDLPFRSILDAARSQSHHVSDLRETVVDSIFLELVSQALAAVGRRMGPPVYGLLASHGRVGEALSLARVSPPSMYKFRALEAVYSETPTDQRHLLGAGDGIEMLVAAAIDIPLSGSPVVGTLGMDRRECLTDAAVLLVPSDLDRAKRLAELADGPHPGQHDALDKVFRAAALEWPSRALTEFLPHIRRGAYKVALEIAETLTPGVEQDALVTFAADLALADDDARIEQARLLPLMSSASDPKLRARLSRVVEQIGRSLSTATPSRITAARIAELARFVDAGLTQRFLQVCERPLEDNAEGCLLIETARVSAAHGRIDDCLRRVDMALPGLRALGWYGPAADLAVAAQIVAPMDGAKSEQIADEAMALLEPYLSSQDPHERSRLDGVLANVFTAFRIFSQTRALRVARAMSNTWVASMPWDSAHGSASAIALIGIDARQGDVELSAVLLQECLNGDDEGFRLGRPLADRPSSGLFSLAAQAARGRQSNMLTSQIAVGLQNTFNYWHRGLRWRAIEQPIDVIRSIDACFPYTASWARTIACAVPYIANRDLDHALAMSLWIEDPAERFLALSGLAPALASKADERRSLAEDAKSRALEDMALCELKDGAALLPASGYLHYLNSTLRSRFESALFAIGLTESDDLFARDGNILAELHQILHFQKLFEHLKNCEVDSISAQNLVAQFEGIKISEKSHPWEVGHLLLAAFQLLKSRDPEAASALASAISLPPIRLKLEISQLSSEDAGTSATALLLDTLKGASRELSPPQIASAAAFGIRHLRLEKKDAALVLLWLDEVLLHVDPLYEGHALVAIQPETSGETRIRLLQRVVKLSNRIGNPYLRADLIASVLGPALESREPTLVRDVISSLIESGWMWLAEGLCRSASQLAEIGGMAIFENIDRAMRKAQGMAMPRGGDPNRLHLDGVLAMTA